MLIWMEMMIMMIMAEGGEENGENGSQQQQQQPTIGFAAGLMMKALNFFLLKFSFFLLKFLANFRLILILPKTFSCFNDKTWLKSKDFVQHFYLKLKPFNVSYLFISHLSDLWQINSLFLTLKAHSLKEGVKEKGAGINLGNVQVKKSLHKCSLWWSLSALIRIKTVIVVQKTCPMFYFVEE